MARFDQKVTIDVEVNNLSKLEKIGDAASEISEAGEALDGFDESLQEVEGDFDNLANAIDSQEGVFAGVGDDDDALGDFRDSISRTRSELEDLDDATQGEMTVKAKVDKDDFIKQVKTDIEDRFDDDNVEVPVAPSSDLEEVDTSQLVREINNEVIPDVEQRIDKIDPVLAESPKGERGGGINIANIAKEAGDDLDGVRESEQVKITPRIKGDVKWEPSSEGGYNQAIKRYNTRIEGLESDPRLQKIQPKIDGNIDFEGLDEGALDLPEGMGEDLETARKLAQEIDNLNERKEELNKTQEKLGDTTETTAIHTDGEADSFDDLTDSGTDLADAKKAAKESNNILNKSMMETADEGAFEEMKMMDEVNMSAKELLNELGVLSDEQANLENQTGDTVHALSSEKSDTKALAEGMDGLAGAKKAASNANKMLGEDAEATSRELHREFDISKDTADAIAGVKDESNNTSRASRRLRNSLDETTDSMRAANKVGDLFEDGLGSLSLNLGAFTVALRNFLTQIPLLLAGLGALGSAASGVAASFLAASGAIGGAIGAGALANAQQLDEEYSEIEGTGEALQEMLARMRELFVRAVSPLTDNTKTIEVFRQVVEGLAGSLSLIAETLDELMTLGSEDLDLINEDATEGADEVAEDINGIVGLVDELGSKLAEPFEELNAAMSFAFINLQDEFVDMSVGIIQGLADLTRFATKFTNEITETNGAFEQFTQTLAEMAQIGQTALGGLIPVLQSFSSIVQTVAEAINSMDQELVGSLITFVAIMAALNKVSGFMSSFIGIIPNLVVGLKSADGSMLSLMKSFGSFIKQSQIAGTGFISLSTAVGDARNEMTLLNLQSANLEKALDGVGDTLKENTIDAITTADSLEELQNELIELALESDAGEDELDELARSLTEVGLSAEFAEENLEDIDAVRDPGRMRTKAFGSSAAGGATVGAGAEVAGGAIGKLGKKSKVAKTGLKSVLGMLRGGNLIKALGGLKATVSALIPLFSLSLGPALAIVAVAAGALVGILGNLDQIMSGLSAAMSVLADVGEFVGEMFLELSIAIWNGLYDVLVGLFMIIEPFINLFKVFGSSSEDAGGSLDTLVAAIEYVVDFTVALIDAIGGGIRIVGTFVGIINQALVVGLVGLISLVKNVIRLLSDWFTSIGNNEEALGKLGDSIDFVVGKLQKFMQFIKQIPEESQKQMDALIQSFQDGFNDLIGGLNNFIKKANKVDGFNMETIEKVDFGVSAGEGAMVDRAEVAAGKETLFDSLAPSGTPSVNLEETNETNYNTEVDANPEDKAQLSRITKDAIEQANTRARRRQGTQ